MISTVPQAHRPLLSAITSLNVQRRDDALHLLAREYGGLTSYDVCKTQVLADVFQVIQTGKVIFGGALHAMPFGPVVKQTLDDCQSWVTSLFLAAKMAVPIQFDQQPLQPSNWTGKHNNIAVFQASPEYARRDAASWDWFSDIEQANIRRAYDKVRSMTWVPSQAYFHEPISAIGYAYHVATQPYPKPFKRRVLMNWFDVLDGAERIEQIDCSYARAMLGLWV